MFGFLHLRFPESNGLQNLKKVHKFFLDVNIFHSVISLRSIYSQVWNCNVESSVPCISDFLKVTGFKI